MKMLTTDNGGAMFNKIKNQIIFNLRKYYYENIYIFPVEKIDKDVQVLKRHMIPTENIRRYSGRKGCGNINEVREDIGTIQDGNWDENSRSSNRMPKRLNEAVFNSKFSETLLYKSFELRFNRDRPWSETPYYKAVADAIKKGYFWHGCESESDVKNLFNNHFEDLYTEISNNGYRTQDELETYASPLAELANEIVVDLARDKEPLLVSGRHRLAITKVEEIERIPVTIAVRHKELFNNEFKL